MAVWQIISAKELSFGLRMDPEFYQPKYFELEKNIKPFSKSLKTVVGHLNTGKTPKYYEEKDTVPVIRSGDLDNLFLNEYTPNLLRTYEENKGINLSFGDILISAIGRGSIGKVSLYVGNGLSTTVSEVIALQDLKIDKYFLTAFLSSNYGKSQIDRQITGSTGQLHLIRQYLENILIPVNLKTKKIIKELYVSAQKSLDIASTLYPEAETELLKRMEWNKINIKHILHYRKTSDDVLSNERIDPEFYQPKFTNLIKHLKTLGSKKVRDFCSIPNRGVQPLYDKNGKILVINSKHLGPTEIDIQTVKKTTREFYDEGTTKKALLKKYDVLMYSTGAYVGRTNIYLEDALGIASNHVTIIRPDNKICNPAYLALFLNSPAGLMQTNQQASGSAQREIYPQDINKYEVFVPEKNGRPDLDWQNKLANKIIQSYEAKSKARKNLQKAKELIEDEIKKLIN